jgi:hypothetical protein
MIAGTPLIFAAEIGEFEMVKLLLGKSVQVNAQDGRYG